MPTTKKKLPAHRTQRDEMVAQGNDLIRHARFQLTALEQNLIYFCMSKVKPNDKDLMRQTFNITDFCETTGIATNNGNPSGREYRRIKAAIKSVSDKSAWVEYSNGVEELVRWFDTFRIETNTGEVTVTLSQSIKPYLIGLIERAKTGGGGYTQALLLTYLALQSKYSKRLYEILKSYLYSSVNSETETIEKVYRPQYLEYDLEELKKLINAEVYKRFADLRRFALEVAVQEISAVTDISVSYDVIKTGKKITGISFMFQHKETMERLSAYDKAQKSLNGKED